MKSSITWTTEAVVRISRISQSCIVFAVGQKQFCAVARACDMRILRVLAMAATATLLPVFAVVAPIPAMPGTNMQATPAAADAQAQSRIPAQPATALTTATPAQSTTTGANDLDQVVCKDMPARTGSRIGGGRECHTQREWKRLHLEARDFTRLKERMKFNPP